MADPMSNVLSSFAKDSIFISREQAAIRLAHALTANEQRAALLIGEPGSSKTIVLRRAAAYLAPPLDPLPLSLIESPCSFATFAANLIRTICVHRKIDLNEIGLVNAEGRLHIEDHTQLRAPLAKLLDREYVLVICIDDFDRLLRQCSQDSDDADRIMALVNYLAEQSDLPLKLLLAFSRVSAKLRHAYPSTILMSAELVELPPVNHAELTALLEVLRPAGFTADQPARERLLRLSGGRPELIWILLDQLWSQRDTGQATLALNVSSFNEDVLRNPLLAAKAHPLLECLYEQYFTPEEQQIILLLVEPEHMHGISIHELKILGTAFQEAATDLITRGYLLQPQGQDEQPIYRPLIGYMSYWLRTWDQYQHERERHGITDMKRRLTRIIDPWYELPPFVEVTREQLIVYGLRPDASGREALR